MCFPRGVRLPSGGSCCGSWGEEVTKLGKRAERGGAGHGWCPQAWDGCWLVGLVMLIS